MLSRRIPRPTGPQNDWPLSDHHLEQLKKAEEHRKPIRTCAILLNILCAAWLIIGVFVVIGALAIIALAMLLCRRRAYSGLGARGIAAHG